MDSQPQPPQFTFIQLFKDPTPDAAINARIVISSFELMQATTLTEEEKETIVNMIAMIARKMASVWNHKQRYSDEQHELVTNINKPVDPNSSPNLILSQELFCEFDEFLVQIKSTLDYLVKVPTPVFGKKVWNLHTFGSKGDEVVRVLRHNLPVQYKITSRGFEKMVFDRHKPWLEKIIDMRDRINHYLEEGISPRTFSVFRDRDNVRVPMFTNEQTVMEVMEIVWVNFLAFVEDFIAMTFAFKTKDEFCFLGQNQGRPDGNKPRWRVMLTTERDRIVQNPGWTKFQAE